jgi:heme/copper-type cytochrome/quinol oxidase subunit 2
MSTWILLAILLAVFVLFAVWANRRYKRSRTNAPEGPDATGERYRLTWGNWE